MPDGPFREDRPSQLMGDVPANRANGHETL